MKGNFAMNVFETNFFGNWSSVKRISFALADLPTASAIVLRDKYW